MGCKMACPACPVGAVNDPTIPYVQHRHNQAARRAATTDSSRSSTPSSQLQSNKVAGFTDSRRKAPKPKADVYVLYTHALVRMVVKVFAEMGKTNALRCVAILEDYEISKLRLKSGEPDGLRGICNLVALVRELEPAIISRSKEIKKWGSCSAQKRLKATHNRLIALEHRIGELYQDPSFRRRFRTFASNQVTAFAHEANVRAKAIPAPPMAKSCARTVTHKSDTKMLVRKAAQETSNAENPYHKCRPRLVEVCEEMDRIDASKRKKAV
jgi:hypothetical protein